MFFKSIALLFTLIAAGESQQNQILEDYSVKDHAAVRAFWTRDRLKGAIEHPVLRHSFKIDHPERADIDSAILAVKNGQAAAARFIDYREINRLIVNDDTNPDPAPSNSQYADKCGYPLGTSAVPLTNYTVYPMQAIGWLFGHEPQQNYSYGCSASLIGNPPNQVLATAGHCVGQKGYFNTNLMFFPEWNNILRQVLRLPEDLLSPE
jgi:hypothetical protein